ncbi:hypothetical protein DFH28DRAFT_890417 [Melampsora americana]|nr:hypothetical protein DFH28DRAFT_890417 [Melampsora americana]
MLDITSSSVDKTHQLWGRLEVARKSKRLGFLVKLDKEIDYNQRTCSMERLRQIMTILEIDQEALVPKSKKHEVVKHYRQFAAPMVDSFVLSLNHKSTSKCSPPGASKSNQEGTSKSKKVELDVNKDLQMTNTKKSPPKRSKAVVASSDSTPTSSTEDLQTSVPRRRPNSKVEELREGLKKSVNNLVSRGFNKDALVKLQSHITNKIGIGMGNSIIKPGDLRRPYLFSLAEISTKDRDTIRKILQVWCPQLWIPINVATSRPMLLALYNLICLEIEEPGLCQGVHFDIFPLEELEFEGRFIF